jgi:hypothetical protein
LNLSEASRQLQIALEYDRRTRTEYAGMLSADDIRAEANAAVEDARTVLFEAWATKGMND